MAFCAKLSGVLRNTVSQSRQVPVTSMLGSLRYMSTKLFIGGLSWGTDDQSLKEAFSNYGEVIDARVIVDRESGRSKGYGFVNFSSEESATAALSAMDGQELQGRNIRVSVANERPAGNRSFGGGYGGGGYAAGGSGGY